MTQPVFPSGSQAVPLEKIRAHSRPLARTRGVYWLLKEGTVVYVGQSECCEIRINAHLKDKDFDAFTILAMPDAPQSQINVLETANIIEYRPFYNRSLRGNEIYASRSEIKKRGYDSYALRRFEREGLLSPPLMILDNTLYLRREVDALPPPPVRP